MLKKTEVIFIFSILRIVKKHAWYLTNLKYSQRNFDRKLCRIYTKRLKEFTIYDRFWMSSQKKICSSRLKEWGCQRLLKKHSVVGHSACLSQSLNSVLQNWMNMDFQTIKLVLRLRRTYTTRKARLHTFSLRLIGDEKNQVSSFFTSVTSTENKEKENGSNERR
jgi:hypothetical protein